MSLYKYKARSGEGKLITGALEASTDKQAADILLRKGLIVTNLRLEEKSELLEIFSKFSKPRLEDISNFTRQMSTMVASGLSLVEALKVLKDQSKPALRNVIEKVQEEVEGGSSLSAALIAADGGFSEVYIALVKAGESAGVLDQVLKKLADTLDKQREFRSKTKGAMIYPVIVVVGMVVVAGLMMVFVIPKMLDMYRDFGAELPLITKILIGISTFMVNFWYIMLGAGFGGYVMLRKWAKTEIGGLLIEQMIFKLPIIGPLKKDMIMAEFSRTMSLLIASGISVLEGLRIVADTLGSKIFGEGIRRASEKGEKGVSMAESIALVEGFPPILSQMLAVGEQTGKVDEILEKLASFYEEETGTKVKALTTVIEPLIMVVMGIGVGFLVAAVIMPIYNLTAQF